eukprot:Skav202272  [mRNA]  locus=scaffold7051:169:965:+ [translate_table: standard]
MAKTLKFALSALALVNGHKPREDVQQAYDQFLKDFGKSYDSVEKQARFTAFAENYEYIQRENAKGHSYQLGLNEFSDMSMDEFKMSKLGMMPESMWGDVPSGGMHKVSNASLPKSVDWRSKAVTPVKNQKQCGSCALSILVYPCLQICLLISKVVILNLKFLRQICIFVCIRICKYIHMDMYMNLSRC